MAYFSTTVASTASNPPVLMFSAVGIGRGSTALTGNNRQEWFYTSTNLTTDITAANFFTDGYYLGMRPGDVVIGTQVTGSSVVTFQGSVATVTTAGAALSTGGLMTSTFN